MKSNHRKYLIIAALLLFAVVVKLVPHMAGVKTFSPYLPWNFSPFWAIFLLMGATLQNKTSSRVLTLTVPIVVLLITDACLGAIYGDVGFGFYGMKQVAVYGCLFATVLMGLYLRKNRSLISIAGMGFLSAVLFYVVTNFAVWYFGSGTLYPHTWSGLNLCYVAGLPYFQGSLLAQFAYVPLLFNPWMLRLVEGEEIEATLLSREITA